MNNVLRASLLTAVCSVSLTFQAQAEGDAARGKQLSVTCAACHGADGNSAIASFPKLAGQGEKYLLKQMQDVKSGKRVIAEMTGQLDNLSEQDLNDIAVFFSGNKTQLSGSKKAKVQLNSGMKTDSLALGEKVYRAGNAETGVPACTGCHSPTGKGNGPAAYPRLGGQHPEYIAKQLKDFRAGNRTNDTESMIMRGAAKHLSDAEIEALANYIAGLH